MLIAPVKDLDVQIELAMFRERMPEMLGQLDRKCPDLIARVLDIVDEVRTSRQINHGARQRLVHRRMRGAETNNAFFISKRPGERLAQTDRRVLYRMVVIDLQFAFARHLEIEQPVARKQFEHVVEKRNARVDPAFALAVEVERDANVSLFGFAFDFSLPSHMKKAPSRRLSSCRSLPASRR